MIDGGVLSAALHVYRDKLLEETLFQSLSTQFALFFANWQKRHFIRSSIITAPCLKSFQRVSPEGQKGVGRYYLIEFLSLS